MVYCVALTGCSRLNTATHGASAGNTRARAGPEPGWKTRTHKRYVSKDRPLLRRLEDVCATGSERDRPFFLLFRRLNTHEPTGLAASLDLRRHFHARTTELLVPLARYLHTLIPTPAERAAAPSSAPLRMRAFNTPAFLASLTTGAALPFRSTARRKEFYERWLRTPTFGVWLGLQEGIVQGVLEGG
jgi:hypothetical protein